MITIITILWIACAIGNGLMVWSVFRTKKEITVLDFNVWVLLMLFGPILTPALLLHLFSNSVIWRRK